MRPALNVPIVSIIIYYNSVMDSFERLVEIYQTEIHMLLELLRLFNDTLGFKSTSLNKYNRFKNNSSADRREVL
jgi:hypothetical protein